MASEQVLKYWKSKWEEGDTPWHRKTNHESLVEYKDNLTNGRSGIKIFFPLCGKSVDMIWLYEAGHTIVGVDISDKAIKDFFIESKLKFREYVSEAVNCKVYETSDGRLKIFICDILKFNRNYDGLMDAAWDRGSLVAVEKEDRKAYVKMLLSVLAPGFRVLTVTLDYKDWFFTGCPRCVSKELIYFLFGNTCSITLLKSEPRDDNMIKNRVQADVAKEEVWLISDKCH